MTLGDKQRRLAIAALLGLGTAMAVARSPPVYRAANTPHATAAAKSPPIRTASVFATPPPKQNPTTPILPVESGRSFNHRAAATKSSSILFRSTC